MEKEVIVKQIMPAAYPSSAPSAIAMTGSSAMARKTASSLNIFIVSSSPGHVRHVVSAASCPGSVKPGPSGAASLALSCIEKIAEYRAHGNSKAPIRAGLRDPVKYQRECGLGAALL